MYLIRGFCEWMFVRYYHYKGFFAHLKQFEIWLRGGPWPQLDAD